MVGGGGSFLPGHLGSTYYADQLATVPVNSDGKFSWLGATAANVRLHLSGGTWKVMDAESRNGVRVNGEPYAQIGLRHGDVLEIGHLRFAFVEPNKAFKLPSEASRRFER